MNNNRRPRYSQDTSPPRSAELAPQPPSRRTRPPSQPAQSDSRPTSRPVQASSISSADASYSSRGSASHSITSTSRAAYRTHPYNPQPAHGRPPKRMRNRYEQQLYDMFGDGPSFKAAYVTDESLCSKFQSRGIPESQWGAELDKFDAMVDERFTAAGGKISVQGLKPQRNDQTAKVYGVQVPGVKHLVIRFFDGGLEKSGAWLFDFYNIHDKRAFNSPEDWKVYISPLSPGKTLMFAGEVKSWEQNNGLARNMIKPGEERFSVPEDVTCKLTRPGHDDFWFKTPVRQYELDDIQVAQPTLLPSSCL